MSYPGQPPMGIPGMPPMPYMVGAPPPIIGGVMPMAHMIPTPVSAMQTSAPAVRYSRNQNRHDNNRRRERESGPPVTVFIGNIMDRAPDVMIRHILGACGHVLSWKRVQAFGFCEYAGPDAGLRAVRLLHDMEIGTKKLVVKVDAKAKVVLDQFKAERRKKLRGGQSPLQDETSGEGADGEEGEDYMDEGMRVVDADALARISQIIAEHAADLEMAQVAPEEHQTKMVAKSLNLDDAEIEESKRDLITREIGKFREVMKKQEEEKAQVKRKKEAVEKEEREKREKERRDKRDEDISNKEDQDGELGSPTSHKGRSDSTGSSRRDKRRSRSRSKERDRDRSRNDRDRDRDRDRERDRERERERDRDRERERERERERDREKERDREREREREREEVRKTEREIMREREEEEEAKERKKNERRAREKEAAYQERLRAWETRERRKQKEYEKEAEKRRAKCEAREREAKRLKEFLEDYDDDRDDAKYYKGKELSRRLEERALEAEADSRDRCAERQELQRLRDKLYADASNPDPAAEFERLKAEREEQYKPKPVITIIDEEDDKATKKEKEIMPPIETEPIESDSDDGVQFDEVSQPETPSRTPPRHHHHHRRHHRHHQNHHRDGEENQEGFAEADRESLKDTRPSPAHQSAATPAQSIPPSLDEDSRMSLVSEPEKTSGSNFVPFAMGSGGNRASDHSIGGKTPVSPNAPVNTNSQQSNQTRKKGRIDVKDVFNNDDDDDAANNAKKRKLVPLDYGDEKKKKTEEAAKAGKEESTKSQEEKRKHIKSLIDKIPTDKNALFGYQLDWALIDNTLMEKRIRPWINKKIIEYIGEPEPTLVDFICSKVMAGSSPQGILDDVQMVLDEEAEVFVVKMWRLLIYEVEAKKMGLVK
ncbi:RNA-binding protein 25-like isoform X1 [Cataglyphis hispanica]|uniref:RNA-binding protein 25-like isoform X1 n=1 Tax=Cataglyphis hispanica TaxID=1086592 RepID=UPI00217FB378|nr:RNA-binding protein 25-like isoform X1 [Cataglyphis hispanica]XP_050458634.1 RNA-binding protein 25-like isoform X1 [Cataglyphis hispanica]XP_050458635.1 RNA-binding protein 25-like isoform X1 [Cataglyphis hispanica]